MIAGFDIEGCIISQGKSFPPAKMTGMDRDTIINFPPNKITDLIAEIKEDTVLLNWTAPGEDFDVGKVNGQKVDQV
ncbi:epithelial chloride channel protein-like isoform X1 [Silurus asotus]|uniref:Epithelial chloride channel protein-like isoform X1 n=1 Tax=Silurus asotus TaxID=30991 RepID=A0AAD5B098_SILAS|nr:epithelial chloride channel protein-like isoform X1 [Silurus asotus]